MPLRIGFLILSLFFAAPPAHALKVAVVGAVNQTDPKVTGSIYTGKSALGGGALLEFHVMPFVGFQVGALSLERKAAYESAPGTTLEFSARMIEFPVLLKAYLGHFLSIGGGAYYAKYSSKVNWRLKSAAGESSGTFSPSDIHNSTNDYGALASLALYFPLAPLTKILVDGRYTMGAKNNSTSSGTTHYNDMQLLAGLQFGF